MLRNVLTLGQISRKAIIAAPRRQIANKVKEKQQAFQKDDGLPVHLKGGLSDLLLYRFTLLLCLLGLGSIARDLSGFSKS